MGTAGGVGSFRELLGDGTFVVVSGDALTDVDLSAFVAAHRRSGGIATLAVKRVDDPSHYGVVVHDEAERIIGFQEKPPRDEALSDLCNCGIYAFEPAIFDYVPPGAFVDWAKDVFPALLAGDVPFHIWSSRPTGTTSATSSSTGAATSTPCTARVRRRDPRPRVAPRRLGRRRHAGRRRRRHRAAGAARRRVSRRDRRAPHRPAHRRRRLLDRARRRARRRHPLGRRQGRPRLASSPAASSGATWSCTTAPWCTRTSVIGDGSDVGAAGAGAARARVEPRAAAQAERTAGRTRRVLTAGRRCPRRHRRRPARPRLSPALRRVRRRRRLALRACAVGLRRCRAALPALRGARPWASGHRRRRRARARLPPGRGRGAARGAVGLRAHAGRRCPECAGRELAFVSAVRRLRLRGPGPRPGHGLQVPCPAVAGRRDGRRAPLRAFARRQRRTCVVTWVPVIATASSSAASIRPSCSLASLRARTGLPYAPLAPPHPSRGPPERARPCRAGRQRVGRLRVAGGGKRGTKKTQASDDR